MMFETVLGKVKAIRRRLLWIAFCRHVLLAAGGVAIALACFVLISRLFLLPIKLEQFAPWPAGLAVCWLMVWTWLRRVRLIDAALQADQTLGLKERLLTALAIRQPRNEAEEAVLQDAVEHARAIRPARVFKMNLQRELRFAAMPLVVLAGLFLFMPQFDLLARQQEAKKETTVQIQARQEAAEKLEQLSQITAAKTELQDPKLGQQVQHDLAALTKQLEEGKLTPDQLMAKAQTLQDKLASRKDELEKQLRMPGNLQSKGEGRQTGEMSRQMEKGNFNQAAKELAALKKKMQEGKLSEQEKAQLQKELQMLAQKLGKDQALAQALGKAAEKMANGKQNEALANMEDAAGQLMDMEQMMKELAAAESVQADLAEWKKSMCKGNGKCASCGKEGEGLLCSECQGKGEWKAGEGRKRSKGMGGPGVGEGQVADKKETETGYEKKKIKGEMTPGRIIARMKVDGEQLPGEITTEYETIRVESAQQAEDTIEGELMPLEYKSLVRNYFDAIKYGDAASSATESK